MQLHLKKSKTINMKKLIFIIAAMLVVGCKQMSREEMELNSIPIDAGPNVDIQVIGGCEYVVFKNGYAGGITHKGNCKFCEQRKIR